MILDFSTFRLQSSSQAVSLQVRSKRSVGRLQSHWYLKPCFYCSFAQNPKRFDNLNTNCLRFLRDVLMIKVRFSPLTGLAERTLFFSICLLFCQKFWNHLILFSCDICILTKFACFHNSFLNFRMHVKWVDGKLAWECGTCLQFWTKTPSEWIHA